jgi:hypothetical protein
MGALAGKMAECVLQMANAQERGDTEGARQGAADLIKVVFAIQHCTAKFAGEPWAGLEAAWRTMGKEAGWLLDREPDRESAS